MQHLEKDMEEVLKKSPNLSYNMLFKLEYSSKELLNKEMTALKEVLPSPHPTSMNPLTFEELTPFYFGSL